jgi:catechol 2,3-dioxygenase-like lactoylglutathione lyase family enzyme
MPTYVPSTSQLVIEIFVRDLERALSFYEGLGFKRVEMHDRFVSLAWEEHQLFLDEHTDPPPAPDGPPRVNVRVMVRDVNAAWERACALGAPVAQPVADRTYGLRDFTIVDPDGFGVRFASRLT